MKELIDLTSLVLALGLASGMVVSQSASWAADVTIRKETAPYLISAPNYEAVVAGDGCLTNLRIGGKEFLAPGVSISRGSYFYHQGAVKMTEVEQPEANVIVARSDAASIRYEFGPDRMAWVIQNRTKETMPFFIVLAEEVEAVKTPQGEVAQTVVNATWEKSAWFREDARLELAGGTKQWGPWSGEHQVWEATLGPGEERRIELVAAGASEEEVAQIDALNAPAPEADLTLFSPLHYQVFQRSSEKEGSILISGRTLPRADRIEYRITGKPRRGRLSGKWRKLAGSGVSRGFSEEVSLPAGGWYRLEVRASQGGRSVAEAVVEKFGVGEVFVGTGQSNSTNCGQFKTQQTTGMVSSFSGEHWQIADDPQPGVADRTQGGSFWPAFGDAMYARYQVPIGVATTGFGGTSVTQWQPETDLFKWMMTRLHQLGRGGFRGVLWHQGESDVQRTAEEYADLLKTVIVASKAQAGWEFPWFVAQVSYHNPDNPSFPTTREAQERLWRQGVALEGPDTDTLTGDYRDFDGKGIHFSPKGLKAHGEMWAEKVGAYLDNVLDERAR